ncbi:MAG: hypothetical protein KDK38_11110 [Leptospiraceae bacterium]|nr:hypothetical protein [Leptospiraceae bacterium]
MRDELKCFHIPVPSLPGTRGRTAIWYYWLGKYSAMRSPMPGRLPAQDKLSFEDSEIICNLLVFKRRTRPEKCARRGFEKFKASLPLNFLNPGVL